MNVKPKLLVLGLLGMGIVSALILLTMGPIGGGLPTAMADDQDGVIVGLDMDPTGNTATSLGTIDDCISVSAGDVIDIDVFINDIEAGPDTGGGLAGDECIAAFGYSLAGWPASGTDGTAPQITAKDHVLFLAAQGAFSAFPFDEAVPDGDDPYRADIADFGDAECVSTGQTQGVLGRYTLDTTGAAPAVYSLSIYGTAFGPGSDPVVSRGGGGAGELAIQAIWDSNFSPPYGAIAVGVACPVFADAKIVSQDVRAADCNTALPTSMPANTDTDVCLRKVLRQDDVATLDVSVTPSLTPPGDCTAIFQNGPSAATLTQGVDNVVGEVYRLNCTAPSTHNFTFGNTIAITSGETDPDLLNNTASTPFSIDVLEDADVEIQSAQWLASDCSSAAPTEIAIDGDVTFCLHKTLNNIGTYGPAIVSINTGIQAPPAGCTMVADPGNPTTANLPVNVSVFVDELFTVNCDNLTSKVFTVDNSITVTGPSHVSDPLSGNNDASSPLNVDVVASADLVLNSLNVVNDDIPGIAGNQVIVVPNVPESIQTTYESQNNGPFGPVLYMLTISVGDTTQCDVEPNSRFPSGSMDVNEIHAASRDWDVTWTGGDPPNSCTLSFTANLSINQAGVSDPTPGNNSGADDVILVRDADADGIPDDGDLSGDTADNACTTGESALCDDNCEDVSNPGQDDLDSDGEGDICDPDDDGDTVADGSDNCPTVPNPTQTNTDGDALGDACDPDDDNDGTSDTDEIACGSLPLNAGSTCEVCDGVDNDLDTSVDEGYPDTDVDGVADCVDTDDDNDTVPDASDNCPLQPNPEQTDTDGDGIGDECEGDDDGDTVIDAEDNCPTVANADQLDTDADGTGDACEDDDDNDEVLDAEDNCPVDQNADQTDTDGDGLGDACDDDDDGDGYTDTEETDAGTDPLDATSFPGAAPPTTTVTPEATATPETTATAPPGEVCSPVFPGTYNGEVRVDGQPAPNGSILKALIGGVEWGSITVSGGLYAVDVPQTLPVYPPCFEAGTITFEVDGAACTPTADWASGLQNLDLTCAEAPAPGTPTATVTVTPGAPTGTGTPAPAGTPKATPVAPPATGSGPIGGGSTPWTAALGVGTLLALALAGIGLLRTGRRRAR